MKRVFASAEKTNTIVHTCQYCESLTEISCGSLSLASLAGATVEIVAWLNTVKAELSSCHVFAHHHPHQHPPHSHQQRHPPHHLHTSSKAFLQIFQALTQRPKRTPSTPAPALTTMGVHASLHVQHPRNALPCSGGPFSVVLPFNFPQMILMIMQGQM